ncbi:MAG TPA: hypothetical protein VFK20_08825 [Vicinamibacterales bacterium]|nr:hypothetical protein [Vicinamibacterales bacterium]
MKKLAIGCLIIVGIGVVAAAGLVYYGYRQVKSTVSQFAELGQLPDIEKGVRAQGPYSPPTTGELSEAQLERLVQVQARVRAQLGARFAELDQKYKSFTDKKEASITDAPALMAAYRDLAAAWLEAKRTQVEALNDAKLSLAEYRWIRSAAYAALGMPFVDLDFAKMAAQARKGLDTDEPMALSGAIGESGPEANKKLVQRFKKQLEDNIALASFGL